MAKDGNAASNTPNMLCLQIATDEDSGVLLYKGDDDHIAMELYRGRLRVSYDTGSYPPSAIYRYTHRTVLSQQPQV